MFACSFNKYTFSSLSLALLSVGFLSCGGGGGGDTGSCLPAGSRLDLLMTVTNQDDPTQVGPFTMQLTGNGSDVPIVSVNGAGQDPTNPTMSHVVYRRTSVTAATLDGQFSLATGQFTLPGPIVVTTYDKVFVSVTIAYNASAMNERTDGTCTGTVKVLGFNPDDDDEPVHWLGAEGFAGYDPFYE